MMFPVACRRELDESAEGFILRTLEANGHRLSNRVWASLRPGTTEEIAARLDHVPQLAEEAPKEKMWEPPGPEWWRRRPNRRGERRGAIASSSRLRACPACLAEREVRLRLWNIGPLAACPRHGCCLRDECDACGAPYVLQLARLAHCSKCGASIANAAPVPADPGSLALAKLLDEGAPPVWPGVRSASAGLTIDAAMLFGVDPAPSGGRLDRTFLTIEQAAERSPRAFDVLGRWPDGFYDWLDRRRLTVPDVRQLGSFGPWLMRLRELLEGHDAVRKAASDYFTKRWDGIPIVSHSVFIDRSPRSDLLAPHEAARMLGCRPGIVVRMVREGVLNGRSERLGRRQFTVVERTAVEQYLQAPPQFNSMDTVQAKLGIRFAQVKALVRHGLLERHPQSNVASIYSKSVDRLLASLSQRCQPLDANDRHVRLGELPLKHIERLSAVVGRVLAGELDCFEVPGAGLHGFAIRLDDILGYRSRSGAVSCSSERTAELLRMREMQVGAIAAAGCLQSTVAQGRRRRLSISAASIEQYHGTYVGTRELAARWRTSSRMVLKQVGASGVKPIVASDASRHISAVWLRADIAMAFGPELLDPQPFGKKDRRNAALPKYLSRQDDEQGETVTS